LVYRSEDNGITWESNSPQHICILDANQMCTVESDHMSSFTYLFSASSFYINNDDAYTNTENVTIYANIPKANYAGIQNTG